LADPAPREGITRGKASHEMSFPEGSGRSAIVDDLRSQTDRGSPLRLVRLWPQVGPGPSEGPGWFVADRSTPTPEPPRLTLVWPTRPPIGPPVAPLSITDVLTAWRAAERELGKVPARSPGRPVAHAKVARLRATYHRLFDERCDRGHPEDEALMTGLRAYVAGFGPPQPSRSVTYR
jgi:hypothetical protein